MIKHIKCIAFVSLLALFSFSATSQTKNYLEFNPQIAITAFTPDYQLTGPVYGAELTYHEGISQNAAQWKKMLHLKSLGFSFNYHDLSGVKIVGDEGANKFGSSFAALAGFNVSLLRVGRLELLVSPAFGLSFQTRTFFTDGNLVIGSHLNFASRIGLRAQQELGTNTRLLTTIQVLHSSNGGFRVPNNGINLLNVGIGIAHDLKTSPNYGLFDRTSFKTHSFEFAIGVGRRGRYHHQENFYRSTLYGGYSYRLNPLVAFSLGVDAVYYYTIYNPNDHARTYQSYATSNSRWRVGATTGPDIWMGKLALSVKFGYYLYYNSLREVKVYESVGLRYQAFQHFSLFSKVFLHGTEADFASVGVAYTL